MIMEGLHKIFGEKFRDIMSITNPVYPLQFERFGDGNIEEDEEFRAHVRHLCTAGHPVACELGSGEEFYENRQLYEAEAMARMAYVAGNPIAEARKALDVSPDCPEAYNVLAQFGANSYEEAQEYYNKAVVASHKIMQEHKTEVAEGKCWSRNHLRSSFRAIHGQANTLRKMGRYKESLNKYLQLEKLDPNFYSWSSYANWRYHVLEVFLKLGDDKGALKFAHKESNSEAFGLASSAGAWYWSLALTDFRYMKKQGFCSEYFASINGSTCKKAKGGAILRAFQAAPVMLEFLTGNRELPNCCIPHHMGGEDSLTNAGTYWLSNAELWKSTPGAIEWAAKNCRTFMCLLMLQKEKDACKQLRFECSVDNFKTLVSKGVFLDARLFENGKTLLHEAVCYEQPKHLKILLDSGAKVNTSGGKRVGVPQPLHMACYYDLDPKIIRILCQAGADPAEKYGLHYSPLQMAAEQGGMRALTTAFDCLPTHCQKDKKVLDSILLAVFHSSCYECVTGLGEMCQRCIGDDKPHPQNATWTGVLDFLTDLNYKPSERYLKSMSDIPGKKKLLAYYKSKLRGETPQEPAEGPSLGRKPLASLQSANLSNFLSALDQMGIQLQPSYGGKSQKQQCLKKLEIEPKLAVCQRCKGTQQKMRVCAQCRKAHYCSRECQKSDWKQHKQTCLPKKV